MTTSDNHLPSIKREYLQLATKELKEIMLEVKGTRYNKLAKLITQNIPYIGTVINTGREVYDGLVEIERKERESRLEKYIFGIVQDEQYNDIEEFRVEDVIPVIRQLTADDETAKTEYYTRLSVSLGRTSLSVMPSDLRYHFIRLVSSLTHYQIEFARELKIRKTVPVRGTASFEEAELALTGQDRGMVMQAIRALQNAGLLKEKTYLPRVQKPNGIIYEVTSDFTILMGLLFHPGDFEPETVELQRKETSDIIIVGKAGIIDDLYEIYLPTALKKAGLDAKFVDDNDEHLTTDWAPLYLHNRRWKMDDCHKEKIKLYLTRENSSPGISEADNDQMFSFEAKTYPKDKSRSKKEADDNRRMMDSVVTSIQTQLNNIKSSS